MFATFCGNSNSKIFYLSDKSNEVYLKFRCYDRSYSRMAENDIDTMINGLDNSPNPFNPVTNIRYELLQKTKVNIVIFDINGRKVKDLLKREQEAG